MRHTIYPDYILSLLPQITCQGKIWGPRYLGPKSWTAMLSMPKLIKSGIFSIFSVFSNITVKLFMLAENLSVQFTYIYTKLSCIFFIFRNFTQTVIGRFITKKHAKTVKLTYIFQFFLIKLEKYWIPTVTYVFKL